MLSITLLESEHTSNLTSFTHCGAEALAVYYLTNGLISMAYELIRLVHFAALFVVSATVLIHYIAFAPEITREDARNLYVLAK